MRSDSRMLTLWAIGELLVSFRKQVVGLQGLGLLSCLSLPVSQVLNSELFLGMVQSITLAKKQMSLELCNSKGVS